MEKINVIMDGVLARENVLSNDYPVCPDYLYVADGKVIASDIKGTVRDLKRALNAGQDREISEIRRCDLMARGFYGNGRK